jgi:hypothetical protein
MIPRTISLQPIIGAGQMSPHELALRDAKRDAEHWYRQVAFKYHSGPSRREHPLSWTIRMAYEAAQKAVAPSTNPRIPGPTNAAQIEAWRALEKKMREIAALDAEGLAEAIIEQQRRIADIMAETRARAPTPPPQPSPAAALIDELQRRGVSLAVAGGKIVATPNGLLLQGDVNRLREHKAEVIRLLTQDQAEI